MHLNKKGKIKTSTLIRKKHCGMLLLIDFREKKILPAIKKVIIYWQKVNSSKGHKNPLTIDAPNNSFKIKSELYKNEERNL